MPKSVVPLNAQSRFIGSQTRDATFSAVEQHPLGLPCPDPPDSPSAGARGTSAHGCVPAAPLRNPPAAARSLRFPAQRIVGDSPRVFLRYGLHDCTGARAGALAHRHRLLARPAGRVARRQRGHGLLCAAEGTRARRCGRARHRHRRAQRGHGRRVAAESRAAPRQRAHGRRRRRRGGHDGPDRSRRGAGGRVCPRGPQGGHLCSGQHGGGGRGTYPGPRRPPPLSFALAHPCGRSCAWWSRCWRYSRPTGAACASWRSRRRRRRRRARTPPSCCAQTACTRGATPSRGVCWPQRPPADSLTPSSSSVLGAGCSLRRAGGRCSRSSSACWPPS